MTSANVGLPTSEGNPFPEIRGRTIRVDDAGRVSLTDIWRAAGSPSEQRPADWRVLPDTQRLIKALETRLKSNAEKSGNEAFCGVIETKRGGTDAGTWAHSILAVQFAAYISADLQVEVNEVFIRYKIADPTLTDELLERSSPKDSEWLIRREIARGKRKEVTDTWAAHGVTGLGYAQCTDEGYRGLFEQTAAEIRKDRDLPAKTNVRNHLTSTELLEVALSEAYAKERIESLNDRGNAECAQSCFVSGKLVRNTREEKERLLQEERERRGLPS